MNAELLRQAAATLRGRAVQATEGPWAYKTTEILGDGSAFGDVRDALGERVGDSDDEGGAYFICDGLYIATMHPGVGLALADWLDTAGADLWAYGPLCCDKGCPACDDELWSPHVRRALAVARLIVGDES